MKKTLPPSVNWHIWAGCNMKCRYCFTTFREMITSLGGRKSLTLEDNIEMAEILGNSFSKVTVVGGEPTLCPYIGKILAILKERKATTAITTNGALLMQKPELLKSFAGILDWIGISVDSFDNMTLRKIGRSTGPNNLTFSADDYVDLARRARDMGIRLKVNAVVNRENLAEDLSSNILAMRPERVKFFRVLPITGQNDGVVEDLLITDVEFQRFVSRHRATLGKQLIAEDYDDMIGSYAMVGPDGAFFDNVDGKLTMSRPILEVGLHSAWSTVRFSHGKFDSRGGRYEW